MKLHEMKAAEGSRKVRNRVGRGTSSGNGKTSGRGQKGQKSIVNLDTLNRLGDGAEVTAETLVAAKIIKDVKSGIKVLANGELTVKNLKVNVAKASSAAKAAIEAAGGSVELLEAK